jgi:hypothetical protein
MSTSEAEAARVAAARKYDEAATELEAAAAHLRLAAMHFRDAEVPRGCAHAFAAYGHVRSGQRLIDENAMVHASKAQR